MSIIFDDFNIVGKYTNSEEGLCAVLEIKPKVLFLDINMPKMSGIDLLRRIEHLDILVVFLTAHSEYAIDAIKLDAFDYLLKPINIEELVRVRTKIKQNSFKRIHLESPTKIKFKVNNSIYIYELDEIIYTRSEGNYTTVYSTNKKPLVLTRNLKKIQEEYLSNPPFFRPHQSYMINLNHVKSYSNYEITLIHDIIVPLSTRRHKLFIEIIN